MSNIQEGTMFPEGMSEEEVAKLSDEQIMKMVIADKRRRLISIEGNRRAAIRRRKR